MPGQASRLRHEYRTVHPHPAPRAPRVSPRGTVPAGGPARPRWPEPIYAPNSEVPVDFNSLSHCRQYTQTDIAAPFTSMSVMCGLPKHQAVFGAE